jgi:hypothetical protein
MTNYEISEADRRLTDVGRSMMDAAVAQQDDEVFNKMCRIGDDLTRVGSLFGTSWNSFNDDDKQFILDFIEEQ